MFYVKCYCEFCSVVEFFFKCGSISRGIATKANSFILEHKENIRDYGELFDLLDRKNGVVLKTFDSREVSLFLDFCFLNNLQELDRIPSLFLKWAKTVSNGIARRISELRKLRGTDLFNGRRYYAESAFCVMAELAYNSTEWEFVHFETISHSTESVPYAKRMPNGTYEEHDNKRTVFLINGKFQCRNTERAKLLEREAIRCFGSWIAISPNGEIVVPCERERFTESGKVKTRITAISPTFSFLRIVTLVASNSFFALELGPHSNKFDKLSTETADSRRKAGYRETLVDEFETILNSDKFSEQEKNVCRALDATFNHEFPDGVFSFAGVESTGNSAMFAELYKNYCAIANTEPHVDHFRKIVKNFKRHVRRAFGITEE